MNKKHLLFTILVAIGCSSLISFHPEAFAVIQLDDSFRPSTLPNFDETINKALEAAADEDQSGESIATTATILVVGKLLSQILVFVGSLTIIFLILSGINYILAFGKDERIERGKRGIFWSLMGLVIVLLAYASVKGVMGILLQLDSSAT